jgi:type IV secretory pathway component VirB8
MSKIPQFTVEHYHRIAETIESGEFFQESKKWYKVLYLSILTDRCFYIMIMLLAGLSALFGIIGFLQLLPISPTQPLLFPMKDSIRDTPLMSRLRDDIYEPVNLALARYHVDAYVRKREDYDFEKVQSRFRFLKGYSDKATMDAYSRYINPASPRSPINKYQKNASRNIDVTSITVRRADGQIINWETQDKGNLIADVYFSARELYPIKVQDSNWRATVEFYYDPLRIKQRAPTVPEMILGLPKEITQPEHKIEPMTFIVTSYSVEELLN